MHGEEYDEATSVESFNAFDAGGDGSVSWPEFRCIFGRSPTSQIAFLRVNHPSNRRVFLRFFLRRLNGELMEISF